MGFGWQTKRWGRGRCNECKKPVCVDHIKVYHYDDDAGGLGHLYDCTECISARKKKSQETADRFRSWPVIGNLVAWVVLCCKHVPYNQVLR